MNLDDAIVAPLEHADEPRRGVKDIAGRHIERCTARSRPALPTWKERLDRIASARVHLPEGREAIHRKVDENIPDRRLCCSVPSPILATLPTWLDTTATEWGWRPS